MNLGRDATKIIISGIGPRVLVHCLDIQTNKRLPHLNWRIWKGYIYQTMQKIEASMDSQRRLVTSFRVGKSKPQRCLFFFFFFFVFVLFFCCFVFLLWYFYFFLFLINFVVNFVVKNLSLKNVFCLFVVFLFVQHFLKY